MNRIEFVNEFAAMKGVSPKIAADSLECFSMILRTALGRGEEAIIPGIGKLVVVDRVAREINSGLVGKVVQVPAHRAAKLKPGVDLKRLLNPGT